MRFRDDDGTGDVLKRRIIVTTDSLSFFAELSSDGKEVVDILSPFEWQRMNSLRQSVFFETGSYAAHWGIHFDSFADMLDSGRLELKPAADADPDFLTYEIVSMRPRNEVLHPESTLLSYEGEIRFRRTPGLCVDSIKLKTVYADGDPTEPVWLEGRFRYQPALVDSIPILASSVWEMRSGPAAPVDCRWSFDVLDVVFDACGAEDFTLSSCGLSTPSPLWTHVNFLRVAWCGGGVLILFFAGVAFLSQRR